ncbi:MAG: hypothetical protein ACXVAY_06745 [Mucilaginibacter sp.]
MKNSIQYLFLISILVFSSCSTAIKIAPTKKTTNLSVKSSRFRGTIFTERYPSSNFHVSDINFSNRFTPSKDDIQKAEAILKQQIKEINKSRPNQYKNSNVIDKHIYDYFRQYVGFIGPSGEKYIHINFYWDKYPLKARLKGISDDRLHFEDDYAIVFDGGSHYWQININLTTQKATDLQVNGLG